MNKNEIKDFFDYFAPFWDERMIDRSVQINKILDNAGVKEKQQILDVACGTGVMIPYYMRRNVVGVTAIDISCEMIKIAKEKYSDIENLKFICGDVEVSEFDRFFDHVVVYNAFPHFINPDLLIKKLCSLLKNGGTLTIAHGFSRDTINNHHNGPAKNVSNGLMSVEELSEIVSKYADVVIAVSDEQMYQVSAIKHTE